MPKFSLVVGYRDREISRITRFLQSLSQQSFTDFECILVDYGSQPEFAHATRDVCSKYSFCTYLYTSTQGWYWNRSHALNIGIRKGQGEYVLCTDIDMIFSRDFLKSYASEVHTGNQLVTRVQLLPESFTDYDKVDDLKQTFELTSPNAMGGAHCVQRQHLESIRGYDEFYRIWGREDRDCIKRLENSGLTLEWHDQDSYPIYHQWHPRAHAGQLSFPRWYWDQITLYYLDGQKSLVRNSENWGSLITDAERPALKSTPELTLNFPHRMGAARSAKMLEDITIALQEHSGQVVEVEFPNSKPKRTMTDSLIQTSNRVAKMLGLDAHSISSFDLETRNTIEPLHFFILSRLQDNAQTFDYAMIQRDKSTSVLLFQALPIS